MKDQPWDLNQTWHVGRKWCRFIDVPQTFRGPSPKNLGSKKNIFDRFSGGFCTRRRISPEWNVTSTNQNTGVNRQYVPYKVTYFSCLWPRNCCDPLAYWDPPHENTAFFQILSKKSAGKFLCVKTFSGKVVTTSCLYLMFHRWIVGDVPIYLKFAIKVTCPMKIQLFPSLPSFPHKGQ